MFGALTRFTMYVHRIVGFEFWHANRTRQIDTLFFSVSHFGCGSRMRIRNQYLPIDLVKKIVAVFGLAELSRSFGVTTNYDAERTIADWHNSAVNKHVRKWCKFTLRSDWYITIEDCHVPRITPSAMFTSSCARLLLRFSFGLNSQIHHCSWFHWLIPFNKTNEEKQPI